MAIKEINPATEILPDIPPSPRSRRGGRRNGAGRPRAPNRANALRAENARRTGPLPSEGMLAIGRICEGVCNAYRPKFVRDKDNKIVGIEWTDEQREAFKDFARLAADCYGKAAPYFEQKFATLAVHGHLDLSQLTDEEVFAIEAVYKRINGNVIAFDPAGSGEAASN